MQINIFKSIVLLLNRMSKSSISDYIEDQNYFLAYFNLRISSMRVNSDACVLCKKYMQWSKLAQQASLNKVFVNWQEKSENIKCIPVEKIDIKREEDTDRIEKNKQYMIASHRAKKVLDVICGYMDTEEIQREIVDRLFPNDVTESVGELIAILKVLGRPFLSFRKEEKEAVFGLMLIMLDALLRETEPERQDKLSILLKQIREKDDQRAKVVTILVNRLAELESNYIIRKRSIRQILDFCVNHISDPEEQKVFVDNYLNRVKQLVGQSNDFAKGLYLEYLLLYGTEYQNDVEKKSIVSLCGKDPASVFRKNAYLENTKLINYGIECLADSFSDNIEFTKDSLVDVLNENYYFDNFNQYLMFHHMINIDENQKVQGFLSDTEYRKIEGMVHFELLYQSIFGETETPARKNESAGQRRSMADENIKDTFMEMMKYLRDASGALDGEIIIPYGKEREGRKYIALELGKSTELRSLENNEHDFIDFWVTLNSINEAVRKMWNLQIQISVEKLKGYRIRCGTLQVNNKKIYPQFDVLYVLFLAILQNVKKHRKQTENQMCVVTVSVEKEQIWVSNCIDEKDKSKIEEAIRKERYRIGQGISQWEKKKYFFRKERIRSEYVSICAVNCTG